MKASSYRKDIQALRGLAVLAVVLFHATENYFPLGYLGVDVFFVISGFVVTPLIIRIFTYSTPGLGYFFNLRRFYTRRFYRLAPALAVTLVGSTFLILLLGPPSDHERFALQGVATVLLIGNIGAYRYSGDYFASNPNPLIHTWSLSVEEQIYLLLPLLLFTVIFNRKKIKKKIISVFGIITFFSFISFVFPTLLQPIYYRMGIQVAGQMSFYSPLDRIWQFTLGGICYFLISRNPFHSREFSRTIHLVFISALLFFLLGKFHFDVKIASILVSVVAFLIILFKSLNFLPIYFIERLEWFGDRSYSIYLLHMPLIYIAKHSPIIQIGNSENTSIQVLVAVAASVFFGSVIYSKVEIRYRNRVQSKKDGIKTIAVALILTFAIPLTFFAGMHEAQKNQYWGIDKNLKPPSAVWDLEPKCKRKSEIDEPCIYKKPGAKNSVLLLGDSHAEQFSEAVKNASKNTNFNTIIWTQLSCPVQFKSSIKNQLTNRCISQNKKILRWVKRNKPTAIIVSQFVSSNSSQKDLRHALATLRLEVPNIVLVENNPIFPDEKYFMVPRPIFMSPYLPPKYFPESEMQVKDKNASNQLAKWARSYQIDTLNLDSLFCENMNCTRYGAKGWLYRDDDHLSLAGAELAIPAFTIFLEDVRSLKN